MLVSQWAEKASYTESGTAQYDREAMRYLSYALYPIVIGNSAHLHLVALLPFRLSLTLYRLRDLLAEL